MLQKEKGLVREKTRLYILTKQKNVTAKIVIIYSRKKLSGNQLLFGTEKL